MTRRDWLTTAAAALGKAGREAPRHTAGRLLGAALGISRAGLIAHDDEPLPRAGRERADAWLARRLLGEPIAYILGRVEFHALELAVTPAVLIPRHETETVVDLALACLDADAVRRAPLWALDLGTGSGAIALALLTARPALQMVATDVSAEALAVAKANAKRLGLAPRIEFRLGDGFAALPIDAGGARRFACIVSNPPYVAEAEWESLPSEVRDFEPEVALLAGDGGAFHRRLLREAHPWLLPGGWLVMELGAGQAPDFRARLETEFATTWTEPRFAGDLLGHERAVAVRPAD